MTSPKGPVDGLKVVDLTRVLAGPICTQMLGDLGADVLKIERPGTGDDTRAWGPPYVTDPAGAAIGDAAYYMSCNRNKRSVTIDIATQRGQEIVRGLIAQSDIVVENYKVGGLAKYGLDYRSLSSDHPALVYCSITGFGQTGPNADRPGYDFMIQAMGGIMSLTGDPGGPPTKVGVAIADVMCGMNAAIAILAAINHRHTTGKGQHIDIGLYDTQVSWLINEALNYFVSGVAPERLGNAHPNLVPYQVVPTRDGHVVLAIGNNRQFEKFCEFVERPEIASDPRFAENHGRVVHRAALDDLLGDVMKQRDSAVWIEQLATIDVPCGPIQSLPEVLNDPQTIAREMVINMPHPVAQSVRLLGNPLKFSQSPVSYRQAPPVLGEHTDEILRSMLQIDDEDLDALRADGVI